MSRAIKTSKRPLAGQHDKRHQPIWVIIAEEPVQDTAPMAKQAGSEATGEAQTPARLINNCFDEKLQLLNLVAKDSALLKQALSLCARLKDASGAVAQAAGLVAWRAGEFTLEI